MKKYFRYYKVWQFVITKCVRYCKVWQTLLQSVSGTTKWDIYYKVKRNTLYLQEIFSNPICQIQPLSTYQFSQHVPMFIKIQNLSVRQKHLNTVIGERSDSNVENHVWIYGIITCVIFFSTFVRNKVITNALKFFFSNVINEWINLMRKLKIEAPAVMYFHKGNLTGFWIRL